MIKYNIKKRKNEEKKKKWRSYELRLNTSGPKKPSPPLTYFGFCFWFPCSCVRALLLSHSHLPAVHQISPYSLLLSSLVFHCRPSCFKLIIDAIGPDDQNAIEDDAALIDEEDDVREEDDDENDCDWIYICTSSTSTMKRPMASNQPTPRRTKTSGPTLVASRW